MAWKVEWTEKAWNDLEIVADYIARDSPYYAAALVREVRDAARSLAFFANRGRKVPEFEAISLRELLVGNYRLIYQVSEKKVFVVAFIHGARDLASLDSSHLSSPNNENS